MNIKIKSLKASDLVEKSLKKNYLYKDIAFDLEPSFSYNNQLNKKEFQKDVQALYDIEAIKTSISNAFMTSPGQKILNPEFGVDLRRYLFEPIDVFTEELIRDDIENRLPDAEPRVEVEDVTVVGDEDNNQYSITLQINVPSLNIRGVSIMSRLDSNGYTIL